MFFQFMPFVDWLILHSLRFWFFFIRSFLLHLFIPSVHFLPVNFTYGEIFVSNSWLLKNRDKPRPNTLSIYGSLHFLQDTVRELEGEIARLEKEKASLNVALTNKKSEASDR